MVTCNYCGKTAERVTGQDVYPHRPDLFRRYFWMCRPCRAWVGCHERTGVPLGRLARAELRRLKMDAHSALDPLWKLYGWKRVWVYQWLSRELKIPADKCHIGMFDEAQCKAVIKAVQRLMRDPVSGRYEEEKRQTEWESLRKSSREAKAQERAQRPCEHGTPGCTGRGEKHACPVPPDSPSGHRPTFTAGPTPLAGPTFSPREEALAWSKESDPDESVLAWVDEDVCVDEEGGECSPMETFQRGRDQI